MHWRTYYSMKHRRGGEKLTIRDKILRHRWARHITPGCISHNVDPRRQEILFEHYADRPQKSYVVYWRSHVDEYKALLASTKV